MVFTSAIRVRWRGLFGVPRDQVGSFATDLGALEATTPAGLPGSFGLARAQESFPSTLAGSFVQMPEPALPEPPAVLTPPAPLGWAGSWRWACSRGRAALPTRRSGIQHATSRSMVAPGRDDTR